MSQASMKFGCCHHIQLRIMHVDCCGSKFPNPHRYLYCTDCLCQDPSFSYNCSEPLNGNDMGSCATFAYAGDGHCDDDNNNAGCSWDGGGT